MSGRQGVIRWLLALASAVAGLAPAARAQGLAPNGSGPRLEWRAPTGCPTREEVLVAVATLADSDRLRWDRFEVIRGAIARSGTRWSLTLEFVARGGVHQRAMQSGRCSELAEAAAVAIVLAHRIGVSDAPSPAEASSTPAVTDAGGRATTTTTAVAPAAPDPGDTTARDATAAISTRPRRGAAIEAPLPSDTRAASDGNVRRPDANAAAHPVTLSVRAEAALDPTSLGSAAFGATAGLELGWGALSTGLYAVGFPSSTTRLGADQSIEFGLWAGGLLGCYRWGRGLDTCALLEVGRVTAHGIGLREAGESSDPWAAPGLSMSFTSSPFEGFGVTTRVSAFHPLVRGRYRVDDTDVVHRVPSIGFRAALGIDLPLL